MENNSFEEPKVVLNLSINDEIKLYLKETAKWAKFLAIIGYIGIGFLVLFSLFMLFGMTALAGMFEALPLSLMGIIYLLMALLYYFPVNYLNKFANKAKRALADNDQDEINLAFKNLKSMFKFMGILTIVVLCLYALIIVVMIPAAIISGLSGIF
jgi:uncharacterized membrane protein